MYPILIPFRLPNAHTVSQNHKILSGRQVSDLFCTLRVLSAHWVALAD